MAVGPGDVLLFHTGSGGLWGKDHEHFKSGEQGSSMAVADWHVARRIAMTGAGTWSFGAVPGEDPARPNWRRSREWPIRRR